MNSIKEKKKYIQDKAYHGKKYADEQLRKRAWNIRMGAEAYKRNGIYTSAKKREDFEDRMKYVKLMHQMHADGGNIDNY